MKIDWLIVGAGFTGCTLAERIATQLGKTVLLIDRRDHVGGNAYDHYDRNGILVHKYGPHIFHTNSARVWDYLSQFTEWRPYSHHVRAVIDGKRVPVPFNLNSLHQLFPASYAAHVEDALLREYGPEAKVPILKLLRHPNDDLRKLAEFVYDKVFLGYTLKQWDCKPEELDPAVTGRVPVFISRDDRYFQDSYQAMPRDGYSELFKRMLNHKNINVLLNTSFKDAEALVKFGRVVYTGPLDEFFDNLHGELPYRSLRFDFLTFEGEWAQEVGTVNYPNDHDFTRITEQKYLSGQSLPLSTPIREYPQPHVPGRTEPYYPIPKEENHERYKLYLKEVSKLKGSMLHAGRLADYKYYNMDQAVAHALKLFDELIVPKAVGATHA